MPKNIESDELVYRGRVIEVHKVRLRMANGQPIDRDLIHYNGSVVVLPVLDDGRIVMIRNYRFVLAEHLWELTAGNLEKGEDPLAAAGRELTEETGYTAGKMEYLGKFVAAPGTSDEWLYAYLATQLEPGAQQLEPYEEIEVSTLTEDEVREGIVSGKIHDAKTIAALSLYWLNKKTM